MLYVIIVFASPAEVIYLFRLSPKLLLTYMVICGYLPALKVNLS